MVEEFLELWPRLTSLELPAIAGTVMLLIRVWRLEGVQEHLPPRLRWPRESYVGFILVGLLSFMATLVGALATGLSIKAAMYATIPVIIGAIGGHKSTQAIGSALRAPRIAEPSISRPLSLLANIAIPSPKAGEDFKLPRPK